VHLVGYMNSLIDGVVSFNSRCLVSSQIYRLHQDCIIQKTQWCQTLHIEQCTNISICCVIGLGATDLTSDHWLLCHGWMYHQFSTDTNYTVHLSESSHLLPITGHVGTFPNPDVLTLLMVGWYASLNTNFSLMWCTPSSLTQSLSVLHTHTHAKAVVTKLRWFKNYMCIC
jgi:hypothetical protein